MTTDTNTPTRRIFRYGDKAFPDPVEALTTMPEYKNPLNPFYEALAGERPLTLRIIRQHTQLLHEQVDQAQDQTIAINRVIASCKQIPPTPLSTLPLRF